MQRLEKVLLVDVIRLSEYFQLSVPKAFNKWFICHSGPVGNILNKDMHLELGTGRYILIWMNTSISGPLPLGPIPSCRPKKNMDICYRLQLKYDQLFSAHPDAVII